MFSRVEHKVLDLGRLLMTSWDIILGTNLCLTFSFNVYWGEKKNQQTDEIKKAKRKELLLERNELI